MQSEHFDNKIREAADHHHPAYDEKAWEKMEKLLDKHLPQKKDDKRRIIFLLLLFVLLGGGTWFILGRSGHSDNSTSKANQNVQSSQVTSNTKDKQNNSTTGTTSLSPNSSGNNENSEQQLQQKENDNKITKTYDRNKYDQAVISMINDRLKKTVRKNATSPDKINPVDEKQTVAKTTQSKMTVEETKDKPSRELSDDKKISQSNISSDNKSTTAVKESTKENLSTIITKSNTESAKENKPAEVDKKDIAKNSNTNSDTKQEKANSKNKKSNYFFLSLSAGPDLSAAGVKSVGKVKPVYGIGIGFSFHDKFSLKTGFYSSRKIYTASPDEYHPPYNFWTYYPYLEKVDADCRVFEIPLTLSYNFTHSKGHSFFGTAGVSSYLMKRETYNYISKLPSGQTTNNEKIYNNKNKHYFSVVTLSGGYERQLSKSTSIAVEPYMKIPVDGIGIGKMQLNSAGVLFSVLVKPFNERKKK